MIEPSCYSVSSPLPALDELVAITGDYYGTPYERRDIALGLQYLLSTGNQDVTDWNREIAIAEIEIDALLSAQMNEILHHPHFQQIESFWRSLDFLIQRINFNKNILLHLLHISKQEMEDDLEYCAELTTSTLHKKIYAENFGQFGGIPYAAIIADFTFTHSAADIKLLQRIAIICAMAHTPFIAAASASMFGMEDVTEFSAVAPADMPNTFASAAWRRWNSLRETSVARYLGLTTPRFLLRVPYADISHPTRSQTFRFNEKTADHNSFLWGNSAFLLATRIADSFARTGWCLNILGAKGGAIKEMVTCHDHWLGPRFKSLPTEVLISDQREQALSQCGFIPVVPRRAENDVVFYSANSIQAPLEFGSTPSAKQAELNYLLGTQLPYLLLISRIAHHIKVKQREHIGSWKEVNQLHRELSVVLQKFIIDQENPPAALRNIKPLRAARLDVEEVEGEPGWYSIALQVQPHLTYMGSSFTLSAIGHLDRE